MKLKDFLEIEKEGLEGSNSVLPLNHATYGSGVFFSYDNLLLTKCC